MAPMKPKPQYKIEDDELHPSYGAHGIEAMMQNIGLGPVEMPDGLVTNPDGSTVGRAAIGTNSGYGMGHRLSHPAYPVDPAKEAASMPADDGKAWTDRGVLKDTIAAEARRAREANSVMTGPSAVNYWQAEIQYDGRVPPIRSARSGRPPQQVGRTSYGSPGARSGNTDGVQGGPLEPAQLKRNPSDRNSLQMGTGESPGRPHSGRQTSVRPGTRIEDCAVVGPARRSAEVRGAPDMTSRTQKTGHSHRNRRHGSSSTRNVDRRGRPKDCHLDRRDHRRSDSSDSHCSLNCM